MTRRRGLNRREMSRVSIHAGENGRGFILPGGDHCARSPLRATQRGATNHGEVGHRGIYLRATCQRVASHRGTSHQNHRVGRHDRRATAVLITAILVFAVAMPPRTFGQDTDVENPSGVILDALGVELAPGEMPGSRWYRSNRDLMQLEPVPRPSPAALARSAGWLVVTAPLGLSDIGGRGSRNTDGGADEIAVAYHEGRPVFGETTRYTDRGLVASVHRVDREGATVLREEMRYRPDGTIRSIRHCTQEECVTARFDPGPGGGAEWILGEDSLLFISFTADARPAYVRRERRANGEGREESDLVEEEFFTYSDDRLTERRVVDGTETQIFRYEQGTDALLETLHETRRGGRLVRSVERDYDEVDRPVRVVERRRNSTVRTTWTYIGDGGSILERREDEVLVYRETTEQTEEGPRTVRTTMKDGEPVLAEIVVNDVVVAREIYADGRLIRTEQP